MVITADLDQLQDESPPSNASLYLSPRSADEMSVVATWRPGPLHVVLCADVDGPVVVGLLSDEDDPSPWATTQPLVEVIIAGDGRSRGSTRYTNSGVGAALRYRSHRTTSDAEGEHLHVEQADERYGLVVTTHLHTSGGVAALRATTTLRNDSETPVLLQAISSFAVGALVAPDEDTRDVDVWTGTGEQLAENRWTVRPAWSQEALADFNSAHHRQPGRGAISAVSTSTWSTARALPTAALANRRTGRAWAWQVEHNGAWRWELDNVREDQDSLALVLMGPNENDHHFAQELGQGESFTSVPVSIAVSRGGFEGALGQLQHHRRWLRRHRTADREQVLVFNDFMNTLDGDPTTERLLPLIEAASLAGAECFCVDAGWYDDGGDWWPSVGEWQPSSRRFPGGGLAGVFHAIRQRGMRAGLWLEPEVIGVKSSMARRLPDDAFLQRSGRRVVEQQRYFLDMRHPAARAHLDETVDRLVADYGLTYFKLDYNVTPGSGTDLNADSAGAGLLAHNRAHLQWVKGVQARHPQVVLENCSSGAMRADFAMLEHFDLQSTSDQMDFRLYAAVAAGAPVQLLPEQAGNWAYPQSHMSDEEIAFNLVTGLSGRLYLSGFLDRMDAQQLSLVADGVRVHKSIRQDIAASTPSWPLGLPDWYAGQLALVLKTTHRDLLFVWSRHDPASGDAPAWMHLPLQARAAHLRPLYPVSLQPWSLRDHPDGGVHLLPSVSGPSARLYEITHD